MLCDILSVISTLVDWSIDWIVIYALSAIFLPYNNGISKLSKVYKNENIDIRQKKNDMVVCCKNTLVCRQWLSYSYKYHVSYFSGWFLLPLINGVWMIFCLMRKNIFGVFWGKFMKDLHLNKWIYYSV